MKLHLDAPGGTNLIRRYAPGLLLVNERTFATSAIVTATTATAWRPGNLDELTLDDLEPLFALGPEVVLIGTGEQQRFPHASLLAAFFARRIGVEVMDTRAACRTYNVLVSEGRSVAAALML